MRSIVSLGAVRVSRLGRVREVIVLLAEVVWGRMVVCLKGRFHRPIMVAFGGPCLSYDGIGKSIGMGLKRLQGLFTRFRTYSSTTQLSIALCIENITFLFLIFKWKNSARHSFKNAALSISALRLAKHL